MRSIWHVRSIVFALLVPSGCTPEGSLVESDAGRGTGGTGGGGGGGVSEAGAPSTVPTDPCEATLTTGNAACDACALDECFDEWAACESGQGNCSCRGELTGELHCLVDCTRDVPPSLSNLDACASICSDNPQAELETSMDPTTVKLIQCLAPPMSMPRCEMCFGKPPGKMPGPPGGGS